MLKTFFKKAVVGLCLLALALQVPSSAAGQAYPRVDLAGYKTFEYRSISVDPPANFAAGLTSLGGVFPNLAAGAWQEKLQLTALAEMNKDLAITYNIEQQPLTPDRYDVNVNYQNEHFLTFGDILATFDGNEFATTTKRLDGMMYNAKNPNYSLTLVPAGKEKSQLQGRAEQKGNNTNGPYSLGHGLILEGSERIELNGKEQQRDRDYTINYFEGKVYFSRILNETDTFAYNYEYSNIMDLYFPAVSKTDFFGVQGRFDLDLYNWGRQPVPPRPAIQQAVQTFPTIGAPALSEERQEKEAASSYTLANAPVRPYSETVTFQGRKLTSYQDYRIKYDSGEITLLLPVMVSSAEPLSVTYAYLETAKESENIAGDGSRGPYDLTHQKIVAGSETILVDGKPVSGLEYTLDRENGKLSFDYNISNTSSIIINYSYLLFETPPSAPVTKPPYQLVLGGTYLREEAQKSSEESTVDFIETFQGSSVLANNSLIYVAHFPLVSTQEGGSLVIKKDGVVLIPGIDYVVPATSRDPGTGQISVTPPAKLPNINDPRDPSDGYYTGTIKLLAAIDSSTELSVLYTYRKNIIGHFTGSGNGGRGPYYVYNNRNLVPGSEKVEVWEVNSLLKTAYNRNTTYEGDAGDLGYSINYDQAQPYLTFNRELSNNQRFTVFFQYIPPTSPGSNNLQRDVTGFDLDFKLGENGLLGVKGSLANSRSEQVRATLASIESFAGFVPNAPASVQLAHNPVIENSENVYVNNYLINRDDKYLIDYASGKIIFYSLPLSTLDAVVVDYQYADPLGIPGGYSKSDSAHNLELTSKLGALSLLYGQRAIGFNFDPLGSTPQGVGSSRRNYSLSYSPGFHNFNLTHSYLEQNNPLQPVANSSFNRSFERNYSISFAPYNLIELGLDQQNIENGPAATGSAPASIEADQQTTAARFRLATVKRGIFAADLSGDLRKTVLDNQRAASRSQIDYNHLNSTLQVTNNIRLGLDRLFSNSGVKDTGLNTDLAQSRTEDLTYDLTMNLTHGTLKQWNFYAKQKDLWLTTSLPTPETAQLTRNTSLNMKLIPNDLLSNNLDYSRQESLAVTTLGKNALDESFTGKIAFTPLANLSADWSHNENRSVLEIGNEDRGLSDAYTASWTILSTEKIVLNSSYSIYSSLTSSLNGTSESRTKIGSATQNYGLVLKPWPILTINPVYSQEDYQSDTSAAGQLLTRATNPKISLILEPFNWLNFNAYYFLKITTRLSDSTDKHKRNIGLTTTLLPFGWGKIIHSLGFEHNGGEVGPNGTLVLVDYKKYSNDLTLNFNIAQNNPLLEAIVLNFTYKQLKYLDLLPGQSNNDFDARSLVFEGILNF